MSSRVQYNPDVRARPAIRDPPHQFICTADYTNGAPSDKDIHCEALPIVAIANPFAEYRKDVQHYVALDGSNNLNGSPTEVARASIYYMKKRFHVGREGKQFYLRGLSPKAEDDGVYEVTFAPDAGELFTAPFVLRRLDPGKHANDLISVDAERLEHCEIFKFASKLPTRNFSGTTSDSLFKHPAAPSDVNNDLLLWRDPNGVLKTIKNHRFILPFPDHEKHQPAPDDRRTDVNSVAGHLEVLFRNRT